MIDTDKYEGHSKGPWYWDGNLCNDEYNDKHGTEQWAVLDWELGVGDADKQLIADAPLLLAEVKTLRVSDATLSAIAELIDPEGVLQNNENLLVEIQDLLAEVERLRMILRWNAYEELYADWRKVWEVLERKGMAEEMRQEFPNTFADTMEARKND